MNTSFDQMDYYDIRRCDRSFDIQVGRLTTKNQTHKLQNI